MLKFVGIRLLLIAALLAAVEAALRAGVWERFAKKDSHAGVSVTLKGALRAHHEPIAVVTLGNSRAVYGLDHAALDALARRHGARHANLSMPGTHLMTVRVLSDWLTHHRPEVKQRIVALSVADLVFAGNGAYELGIVEPFREWRNERMRFDHVGFTRNDVATFGTLSSAFAYREDIRDLLRGPAQRVRELLSNREHGLFVGPAIEADVCRIDLRTPDTCRQSALRLTDDRDKWLANDCAAQQPLPHRFNLDPYSAGQPLVGPFEDGRRAVRDTLRDPAWHGRTVVVLMPTHRFWLDAIHAPGLHAWTVRSLRALEAEGAIELIDATRLFDQGDSTDCTAFWDLYHASRAGRDRLTQMLLPALERALYGTEARK